jgi:Tfp pilus assembly protein PilF
LLLVSAAVFNIGCSPVTRFLEPLHRSMSAREVRRGQELLAAEDQQRAVASFQEALTHDPRNGVAHACLARIHAAAGRFSRAGEHYRAALKSAPQNVEYTLALAKCLRRQATASLNRPRLLRAATRAYRHALWLEPDNFDAALGLGICYHMMGRLDLAVDALSNARRIDPYATVAHNALADTYQARGDLDRALAECRLALKLDPHSLAAHNTAGQVNALRSRPSKPKSRLARQRALAHFRRSLQLDPHQPHVRTMLADLQSPASPLADATDESPDA